MQKIGWALLIGGGATLVGYWVYLMVAEVFSALDMPLLLRVGMLAVMAGLVVLLGVVVLDRLRERKNERF